MRGEIEKRGKNAYRVRLFLGRDPSGKQIRQSKTIHGTLKDAQRFLQGMLNRHELGELAPPEPTSVNDFLDEWLRSAVLGDVAARTYADYSENLDRYIRPPLGKVMLHELTPIMVQAVFTDLKERLAPRTVRYALAIFRRALDGAVGWKMIRQNPATAVKVADRKRRRDPKPVQSFDQALAAAFLEVTPLDRWRVFFELLLGTGLRPEEALGLQWQHVLWSRGEVHVQQALVRPRRSLVRAKLSDGNWTLEPTKTKKGVRMVPVPPPVLDLLRRHRKDQLEEIAAAGDAYEPHNFVFATPLGAPLRDSNLSGARHFKRLLRLIGARKFQAAREAAGLSEREVGRLVGASAWFTKQLENGQEVQLDEARIRTLSAALGVPAAEFQEYLELPKRFHLYDLRHTYATLSLLAGVQLKEVSEHLGHASISITADIYSHVLPAMKTRACEKLTELVWGGGAVSR